MFEFGQPELDRIAGVFALGERHCLMTASSTNALPAAEAR